MNFDVHFTSSLRLRSERRPSNTVQTLLSHPTGLSFWGEFKKKLLMSDVDALDRQGMSGQRYHSRYSLPEACQRNFHENQDCFGDRVYHH
jgi:hypothetical protein